MKLKLTILLLAASAAAMAQSSSAYVFVAPGGATANGYTTSMLHAGGGADAHIAKGIGFNLELGAMGPAESLRDSVGLLSVGGTYRFRRGKELRVEPFAAGGYSAMFREGFANLYYFGGGINYWASKRVGLRMEFRDHVSNNPEHFWEFRFGVAFR